MKLRLKSSKSLIIRCGITFLVLLAAGRYFWNGPGAGPSFPEYPASNQSPPGNVIIKGGKCNEIDIVIALGLETVIWRVRNRNVLVILQTHVM